MNLEQEWITAIAKTKSMRDAQGSVLAYLVLAAVGLITAMAFTFPLFLAIRERALRQREDAASAAP